MLLSVSSVKNAKGKEKDYKKPDGRGLYLLVKKTGAKYWRFKYRFEGKEKLLALGVFPDVTLARARDLRDEAKKQLASGIDPSDVRRAAKQNKDNASTNSFEFVAKEWFGRHMANKSDGHKIRITRLLEKDLYPSIGNRPISEITAPEMLTALRKIESRGVIETAHRAKYAASQIFRYAVATGRAERDPCPDLKGALPPKNRKHFAAITEPKKAGQLLIAIDGFQGTPAVHAALKLSPLLFARPGELRHMEWTEIIWEDSRWEIDAAKMKMKQSHIVPLSNQALDILKDIQKITGRGRYVFPSARGASRPLSENGVRVALRTMGYDNNTMTPHGFRAMARTILDEVLSFRLEWIEHQLAHAVKDANGRAYNRTTHLKQRTDMMQKWADYLDGLRAQAINGNVVTGNFGGCQ
jgi:integrase